MDSLPLERVRRLLLRRGHDVRRRRSHLRSRPVVTEGRRHLVVGMGKVIGSVLVVLGVHGRGRGSGRRGEGGLRGVKERALGSVTAVGEEPKGETKCQSHTSRELGTERRDSLARDHLAHVGRRDRPRSVLSHDLALRS